MASELVIVHIAEEGGYWAEVPNLPGCATEANSISELLRNVEEAVIGVTTAESR